MAGSNPAIHPLMKHAAFTLVELLVVLAVVAVLAALSVPVYARITQSSRAVACMSNLRQLGGALQLYLNDHAMVMPTLGAARADKNAAGAYIDNTLNTYAANPKVFACPADTLGDATASGTSYYWNSLLNGQAAASLHLLRLSTTQSFIPVLCDKDPFHPYEKSKVNMLYADGHATSELTFVPNQ